MAFPENNRVEESLDPDDWQAMRQLGHQMIEDVMDYLENIRSRPVWQPIPASVKDYLDQPLPENPLGETAAYREFVERILPHPMGNIHPRFWGWVIGTGTPLGMLSEMLAACMNPNLGGAEHVANHVESQVISWCKQMLGYPAKASGLLVSGGSMANLVGLTVARNAMAGVDLRNEGLRALPCDMVLYGSNETHSSIQKSVELLGLGNTALRKIPVNSAYQMDLNALKEVLAGDKAQGRQPFCIVANAGTVNTGAFDDIDALADICAAEGLWLHVDGAFGAFAALSPQLEHLVKGMQRADSLAFDLHKWMYMPIEIGCALVRDEPAHRNAFSMNPHYLEHGGERGLLAGSKWFSDYGVQLSRGFRALKAWMSLKAYGLGKYRRLIQQNVDQARYLARLVDDHAELERIGPVPLNIVCFRYNSGNLTDSALNTLNQELLIRLHESGIAAPSYTTLNGQYVLRAAITNHRSRREDFDILVEAVVRLGRELTAKISTD
jgi:aromatic-L-amino-acid decarboxylase